MEKLWFYFRFLPSHSLRQSEMDLAAATAFKAAAATSVAATASAAPAAAAPTAPAAAAKAKAATATKTGSSMVATAKATSLGIAPLRPLSPVDSNIQSGSGVPG